MSGKTRAQLSEQIGELEETITLLRKAAAEPPRLSSVPEATALAACIRALDAMPSERRGGYDFSAKAHPEIERILRMLASKYGINLVEIRREPCDLPHITPEKREQLTYAIQGAL